MIGQKLGHFHILDEVGSGGMGVVYRAVDEQLSREVAIKVLKGGIFSDNVARKNFKKEAIALSKLNHPNIEIVYEFSTQDGIDFLVLELISGLTLSDHIAKGPLSEKEVLVLGSQLADGLVAAHQQRVLHRDLKPSNIRITSEGRLKILDFGLAKLVPLSVESATTESFAGERTAYGTLPYMAPEQLRTSNVDERVDIYGAGAVLFEMATGRRPFNQTQVPLLIDAILNEEPNPPSSLNNKITPALDTIILKALDKDPDRRYQSARELCVDLQRMIGPTSHSYSAARAHPRIKRRHSLAYFLIALFCLLGITFWQFREPIRKWLWPEELPDTKHLVILPFTNLNGDRENQAFCDGLAETLASKLTQLIQFHGALQVVPTSEVRVEGITGVREARKAFGVNLAINGSVQRRDLSVRITANLIDAKNLRQLQSISFETGIDDAFLQEGLVQQIVDMLELEVGQNEKTVLAAGGTSVGKAYRAYLEGEGYLLRYEKSENLDAAIGSYKQAVALDPQFALGYAGLAKAYWLKYETTKNATWAQQAQQNCRRAYQLNDNLSPVHVIWGVIETGRGRYESGISQFEQALKLDPVNFEAYMGMAKAYQSIGQVIKAEETYKRAIELQPTNWRTYMSLGLFYKLQGRYDEAIEMFWKVVELVPDSFPGYTSLAGVYLYQGRYNEAVSLLQKSISIRRSSKGYWNLGYAYFMQRSFSEAADMYRNATHLGEEHYAIWGNLGDAYSYSAEKDKAPAAYNRAIQAAEVELSVNPRDANALVLLAWYHAKLGSKEASLKSLNQAIAFNQPEDPEFPFIAALVYNHFGDSQTALDWLKRAISRGYPKAELQRIEFDALKNNPEFQALLK